VQMYCKCCLTFLQLGSSFSKEVLLFSRSLWYTCCLRFLRLGYIFPREKVIGGISKENSFSSKNALSGSL